MAGFSNERGPTFRGSALLLYGQDDDLLNPAAGNVVLYYNATTNTMIALNSTGANLLSGGGGGGGVDTVQSVNSNVILDFAGGTNSVVKATTGGAGISLTLLSAVGATGQALRIIKTDSGVGAATIGTTAAQTISGGTSYVLSNQWQYVVVESDGVNWLILANN